MKASNRRQRRTPTYLPYFPGLVFLNFSYLVASMKQAFTFMHSSVELEEDTLTEDPSVPDSEFSATCYLAIFQDPVGTRRRVMTRSMCPDSLPSLERSNSLRILMSSGFAALRNLSIMR